MTRPRLRRAALALVDGVGVRHRVPFQYNPAELTRSVQLGGEGEGRSGLWRSRTPPVETLKLELELDADDDEGSGRAPPTVRARLAALEGLVYPRERDLDRQRSLAATGAFEIAAPVARLLVLEWDPDRVVPVRITELTVTEEAFDADLAPIRARVSLGLRVLTLADLAAPPGKGAGAGADLYLGYLRARESAARDVLPDRGDE